VVALNLSTGKEAWRVDDFPVHIVEKNGHRNHYVPIAGDMGRHTATVGGGMVFAVGNLTSTTPTGYGGGVPASADRTSSLSALSLADGRMAWTVGRGSGDARVLQQARYLTAPTYVDGRLYTLAITGTLYQLLCLDASDGALAWATVVGTVPTQSGPARSWQAAYTLEVLTERASRPSIHGGRVYVTTNAGLVAAFDEQTGAPLWTYRYDSTTTGAATSEPLKDVESLAYAVVARRRPLLPQNPVVVTGGRVVSLPCDSQSVIALNALTGEGLWERQREGAGYLCAIDDTRILTAGKTLTVLSLQNGEPLHAVETRIVDRPAVTRNRVLAFADEQLLDVSLNDYAVRNIPVGDADALVGNVVVADGALLSANVAGVSGFSLAQDR
jgi:outer membrane protein assembly factor BamB